MSTRTATHAEASSAPKSGTSGRRKPTDDEWKVPRPRGNRMSRRDRKPANSGAGRCDTKPRKSRKPANSGAGAGKGRRTGGGKSRWTRSDGRKQPSPFTIQDRLDRMRICSNLLELFFDEKTKAEDDKRIPTISAQNTFYEVMELLYGKQWNWTQGKLRFDATSPGEQVVPKSGTALSMVLDKRPEYWGLFLTVAREILLADGVFAPSIMDVIKSVAAYSHIPMSVLDEQVVFALPEGPCPKGPFFGSLHGGCLLGVVYRAFLRRRFCNRCGISKESTTRDLGVDSTLEAIQDNKGKTSIWNYAFALIVEASRQYHSSWSKYEVGNKWHGPNDRHGVFGPTLGTIERPIVYPSCVVGTTRVSGTEWNRYDRLVTQTIRGSRASCARAKEALDIFVKRHTHQVRMPALCIVEKPRGNPHWMTEAIRCSALVPRPLPKGPRRKKTLVVSLVDRFQAVPADVLDGILDNPEQHGVGPEGIYYCSRAAAIGMPMEKDYRLDGVNTNVVPTHLMEVFEVHMRRGRRPWLTFDEWMSPTSKMKCEAFALARGRGMRKNQADSFSEWVPSQDEDDLETLYITWTELKRREYETAEAARELSAVPIPLSELPRVPGRTTEYRKARKRADTLIAQGVDPGGITLFLLGRNVLFFTEDERAEEYARSDRVRQAELEAKRAEKEEAKAYNRALNREQRGYDSDSDSSDSDDEEVLVPAPCRKIATGIYFDSSDSDSSDSDSSDSEDEKEEPVTASSRVFCGLDALAADEARRAEEAAGDAEVRLLVVGRTHECIFTFESPPVFERVRNLWKSEGGRTKKELATPLTVDKDILTFTVRVGRKKKETDDNCTIRVANMGAFFMRWARARGYRIVIPDTEQDLWDGIDAGTPMPVAAGGDSLFDEEDEEEEELGAGAAASRAGTGDGGWSTVTRKKRGGRFWE